MKFVRSLGMLVLLACASLTVGCTPAEQSGGGAAPAAGGDAGSVTGGGIRLLPPKPRPLLPMLPLKHPRKKLLLKLQRKKLLLKLPRKKLPRKAPPKKLPSNFVRRDDSTENKQRLSRSWTGVVHCATNSGNSAHFTARQQFVQSRALEIHKFCGSPRPCTLLRKLQVRV